MFLTQFCKILYFDTNPPSQVSRTPIIKLKIIYLFDNEAVL